MRTSLIFPFVLFESNSTIKHQTVRGGVWVDGEKAGPLKLELVEGLGALDRGVHEALQHCQGVCVDVCEEATRNHRWVLRALVSEPERITVWNVNMLIVQNPRLGIEILYWLNLKHSTCTDFECEEETHSFS